LLVFLVQPISFRLSIHLGLSFRIFQQCKWTNFLPFTSSAVHIAHAFAICTFQTSTHITVKYRQMIIATNNEFE
jgi:hypothetical protein